MPTTDERREVAARLRAAEYGLEHFTLMAILGFDMDAEPYFDGFHRSPECLAKDMRMRLADLIEPEPERTCRNIHPDVFQCSECYAIDDDWKNPPYCHGCGAKVVSVDATA